MRIVLRTLLCLSLAAPSLLAAQYATPYGVLAGNRIRVTAPALSEEVMTGRLAAFGGDSLVLVASAGRATARLPLADIRMVEASEGFDRWGSARRYGAIAALAGGVIGAASLRDDITGVRIIGFLVLLTGVTYALKRKIWSDVH